MIKAMVRRWLIRTFFIGILVVCVVAWVASYRREIIFEYEGTATSLRLACESSYIVFNVFSPPKGGTLSNGWYFSLWPIHEYVEARHWFLGFGFTYQRGGRNDVCVPLWFPVLLSALTLYFVWRKTRPKSAGKAFPIEPTDRKMNGDAASY